MESLFSGMTSLFFLVVILLLFFYLFAVGGLVLFRENDAVHFGNLQIALLSLFRAASCEDWTDIMYTNMLGCEVSPYYAPEDRCVVKGKGMGWVAAFYFVAFVILGGLVLFSLFIGIICTLRWPPPIAPNHRVIPPSPRPPRKPSPRAATPPPHHLHHLTTSPPHHLTISTTSPPPPPHPGTSMDEVQGGLTDDQEVQRKSNEMAHRLGISPESVEIFQDIFTFLDNDADGSKDGHLDFDTIHPVFDLLLLFSTGMEEKKGESLSMEAIMRNAVKGKGKGKGAKGWRKLAAAASVGVGGGGGGGGDSGGGEGRASGTTVVETKSEESGRRGDKFELRELELIFLSLDIDLSGTIVHCFYTSSSLVVRCQRANS